MYKFKLAFTLAEMMVVMLIVSIVLAAMAPVITTKMKRDMNNSGASSIWKWTDAKDAIYFGSDGKYPVMAGQTSVITEDPKSLLILSTDDATRSHILFKMRDDNVLGRLQYSDNNGLLLGSLSESGSINKNSIAVGNSVNSSGAKSIALGYKATASGIGSIAIGSFLTKSEATLTEDSEAPSANSRLSIAIGNRAKALSDNSERKYNGDSGIAIGVFSEVYATGVSIGRAATSVKNSVSIGFGAHSKDEGSVVIGRLAETEKRNSIAIGGFLYNDNNIIPTTTNHENTIAIGASNNNSNENSIMIGYPYLDSSNSPVKPSSNGKFSISIGSGAKADGENNIAIGKNACSNIKGSNKICIGANSGPASGSAWANQTDTKERIFIGSQSKFNGGDAVLEVHNDTSKTTGNGRTFSNTAVVINGNLVVNGLIFSSNARNGRHYEYQSRGDDNGHTGDIIHFVNESDTIRNYYNVGTDEEHKISDRRLKYVGKENKDGLDKLRELKVFNYTFKKDPSKEPRVGVIAQDLQKVFPNAVKKAADGFLTIRMEDMFFAVINAIKELDTRVTRLEKENKELKIRLEKLEAKIK